MDPDAFASERLRERILTALAAQVATGLAPAALDALRGLDRYEARAFFASAGHLAHYDGDLNVGPLAQLVAEAQRAGATRQHGLLPGDQVRLVGELPPGLATDDEDWVRKTEFTVRYVGDDGTVDIQADFEEDYRVETVPNSCVRSVS